MLLSLLGDLEAWRSGARDGHKPPNKVLAGHTAHMINRLPSNTSKGLRFEASFDKISSILI